jgi:parallel beta-helix repeat protein
MKKSKINLFLAVVLFGGILMISLSVNNLTILSNGTGMTNSSNMEKIVFQADDPINITKDSDFASFPGSGTSGDPYIIEGYEIDTDAWYGIFVANTTAFFEIRDCVTTSNRTGIYLYNISDGTATVDGNTCNNNPVDGIGTQNADGAFITNNICNNNGDDGIAARGSDEVLIAGNTCDNNGDAGIAVFHIFGWMSEDAQVYNNECSNNKNGILVKYSDEAFIENNVCTNNTQDGIDVSNFADDATIRSNICNDNGDEGIYSHDAIAVDNNTCHRNGNDGIIVRYADDGGATVTSNHCDDNNNFGLRVLQSEGVVINNNHLTNNGLFINEVEGHLNELLSYSVGTNYVNEKEIGVFIGSSDETIDGTEEYGQVIVLLSENLEISNQEVSNATYGVYVYHYTGITLSSITSEHNRRGIDVKNSTDITITNSDIKTNIGLGLYLQGDQFDINGNYFAHNTDEGLKSDGSNSLITDNIFLRNNDHALCLDTGSSDSLVYENYFVDNAGSTQACDHGTNNQWYDDVEEIGNYWSTWNGEGNYSVYGLAHSVDLYPITGEDTDEDGLVDILETTYYLTDPNNPDTDGDGYSDGTEVAHDTDPLDPESYPTEITTSEMTEPNPSFGWIAFVICFSVMSLVTLFFSRKKKVA